MEFLPLVAIALLFWFLIIRPASKRQKAQLQMQSAIAVGDQVVLTSGFFGIVRVLADDRVDIELGPGTTVTVARAAIGSVVPSNDSENDSEFETADDVERPIGEPTSTDERGDA
ncbi:preprotein translocase subunit YajC [Nocardioides sp. R-C-SC26]|uniref:preprotein translocase subunit YajC n=1 Tax=Nocardioides sp. R-C-SC26 TaxID=2870414 RepID=UPI001E417259|nr:preprotein translocase subunit YajC [Nocardioides sp. R-C-SC26]